VTPDLVAATSTLRHHDREKAADLIRAEPAPPINV